MGRSRVVRGAAVAAGVAALVGGGALLFGPASRAIQPFPFNHRVHVAAKLECVGCHAGVLDPGEDLFPPLRACKGCHRGDPGANVPKQRLARLIAAGAPLEWRPLFSLPDHVFFSHARHVEVAGLDCLECHREMASLEAPPRAERTLAMDACISCHRRQRQSEAARRATDDCAACHR